MHAITLEGGEYYQLKVEFWAYENCPSFLYRDEITSIKLVCDPYEKYKEISITSGEFFFENDEDLTMFLLRWS